MKMEDPAPPAPHPEAGRPPEQEYNEMISTHRPSDTGTLMGGWISTFGHLHLEGNPPTLTPARIKSQPLPDGLSGQSAASPSTR